MASGLAGLGYGHLKEAPPLAFFFKEGKQIRGERLPKFYLRTMYIPLTYPP
jgi:hypothetical protein